MRLVARLLFVSALFLLIAGCLPPPPTSDDAGAGEGEGEGQGGATDAGCEDLVCAAPPVGCEYQSAGDCSCGDLVCADAGPAETGIACGVDADCAAGLVCTCANDACHDCGGGVGTCERGCLGG